MHGESPYRGNGKDLVQRLLQRGDLDVKGLEEIVAEQKKMIDATGSEASSIFEQPEAEPVLLSLEDADAFLKERGIDLRLESEREEHVKRMIRSGALSKKNADSYGAKFDASTVASEADLLKLVELRKEAPNIRTDVVLGVDELTNQQAWDKWFLRGGGEKAIRNSRLYPFSDYQKVDPKTGLALKHQEPTGKAGVAFIPHVLNLPSSLRSISADQLLAKMARGQKYLGPQGYLRWFLDCVDKALLRKYPNHPDIQNLDIVNPDKYEELVNMFLLESKNDSDLPDVITTTQFANLRRGGNKSGVVPCLGFGTDTDCRRVRLGYICVPHNPYENVGGREAFGEFLS